jgi:hypothetical protein
MPALLIALALSLGQIPQATPPAELKALDFLIGSWRGEGEFVSEGKPQKAVTEWTFRAEGNHLRQEGTIHLQGMKMEESRAFGWDARRKRFWSYTLVEPFPTPRVEWGTYKLGELVWLSDPWDIGAAEGPVESRATTTRDGAALRFRIEVKGKVGWEKVAEGRFSKKPD